MPLVVPTVVRLKTALKMCIQRLRYAQEKQQALVKQARREVAQLLLQGKEQKAYYRVEALINDDIHIELLEILELYCELLHTRVAILNAITDEADLISNHLEDGINEAVRALIYAQLYTPEIKDLHQVKDLLTHKFGIPFLKAILEDRIGVPDKVTKKCSPYLPNSELVNLYLSEIASLYEVPFSGLEDKQSQAQDSSTAQEDESQLTDDDASDGRPIQALENDELGDSKHPITVKKPRKNSETLEHGLKIPPSIIKDVKISQKREKVNEDELEELKRRFEALRR
ncbi:AaceriAFR664Wp [[Ashbya] aceris (nom. inval.)]|nr:AaceriAFR664Wp [[Ashbya] aceris (nom. inval.)]